MTNKEAYAKVTARLIAQLEAGHAPWLMPWRTGVPMSIHGRRYRGINAAILALGSPYASNVWLTFNQARERGSCVRKGEKGTAVMLWKVSDRKGEAAEDSDEESGKGRRFFATTFTVFNSEQCEATLELPKRFAEHPETDPHEAAEAIAARYLASGGPRSSFKGSRAYYAPELDEIVLPKRAAFREQAGYYGTLFHELGHSTGHGARLAREGIVNFDRFGSHQYSVEELIAEFTASFLCARAGVQTDREVDNSAAYLRHWLSKVREEPGLLVKAASAAQKAADLILGEEAAAVQEVAA